MLIRTLFLILGIIVSSFKVLSEPLQVGEGEALLELKQGWKYGDEEVEVPFVLPSSRETALETSFDLGCQPEDSLYLYLEGVAWKSELMLNDLFLGVHDDPFKPWIIPLAPEWILDGENHLELSLALGKRFELYPQQFLGIQRPVRLYTRNQLARVKEPILKTVSSADTLVVWAPYFGASGYIFDRFEAAKMALTVVREKLKYVYFPFEPGREFQVFCADLGLVRAEMITDSSYVCWLNAYEYEGRTINYLPPFWMDQNGDRTIHYDCYYQLPKTPDVVFETHNRALIILMAIFPIISLFLVKLLSPKLFSSVMDWLVAPRRHIDMFTQITSSNPGLLMILLGLKLFLIILVLCLTFFYIQQANLWDHFNLIKSWSLTSYIFYGDFGLGQLFLRSVLVVLGWFAFEQAVIWVASIVFGIKGFLRAMLNLNVMGAYPLIWLMSLPTAFILFSDQIGKSVMLAALAALLVIYLVRQLYISFLGLEKLFGFSTGIKILYICGFNILPYIIWV